MRQGDAEDLDQEAPLADVTAPAGLGDARLPATRYYKEVDEDGVEEDPPEQEENPEGAGLLESERLKIRKGFGRFSQGFLKASAPGMSNYPPSPKIHLVFKVFVYNFTYPPLCFHLPYRTFGRPQLNSGLCSACCSFRSVGCFSSCGPGSCCG